MKYFKQIDSLRAIAVIAVILNHLDHHLLPSGYLGVDIFFVISGFVVMNSLMINQYTSFWGFISSFYKKRFKRLYPALLTCFLFFTPLIFLIMPAPDLSLKTGIASLFAHSNFYLMKKSLDYFGGDASLNLFTHTWSLSLEEQFYFVFPLILVSLGFLKSKNQKKIFLTSVVMICISLGLYFNIFSSNINWAFYSLPTRLWQLFLGVLVCVITYGKSWNLKRTSLWLNILLIILFSILFSPHKFQLYNTILISFLMGLILTLISLDFQSMLLNFDFLKSIGKRSYSLYLWHWPFIVLLKHTFHYSIPSVMIILLLMTLASHLSYTFVELKLRHLKKWGYALTVTFLTLPLFAFGIKSYSFQISQAFFMGNKLENYAAEGEDYWDMKNCRIHPKDEFNHDYFNFKKIVMNQCELQTNTSIDLKRKIFLFGNSYAEQLIPAFKDYLLGSKDTRGYSFVMPNCPLWKGEFQSSPMVSKSKCAQIYNFTIKLIHEEFKPGDVIIFATPFYHFLNNSIFFENGNLVKGMDAFEKFHQEILSLSRELEKKNITLLLTNTLPILKLEASFCYQPWSKYNKMCQFENLIDEGYLKPIDLMNQRFSENQIIDLYKPMLKALRNDLTHVRAYKEKEHLSAYSSKILQDELKLKLDR